MAHSSFSSVFDKSETIMVNGVVMPLAEYRKQIRAKKSSSKKSIKRTKKEETPIRLLPSEIKAMLKSARVMKSLSAYYDNGYKQWGRVANDILNLKEIRPHYTLYRLKAKEMDKTIKEIADISKHNSKAVFQYVEKLSWQLEDIQDLMRKLYDGVNSCGVIYAFGDCEAINGEGRRLGLRILMIRTFKALYELDGIIKKLGVIADKRVHSYNDKVVG